MKSFIWTLTYPTKEYLEELTEKVADIPELRLITALENSEGEIEECRMTFSKELSAEELVNFGALLGIFDVEYAAKIKRRTREDFKEFMTNILVPLLKNLEGLEKEKPDIPEEKAVSEEKVKDEANDEALDNQEEEEGLAPIFQMHVVDISDIDGEMSFSAKEVTPENVDEMPDSQVRILLKDLLKNYKK